MPRECAGKHVWVCRHGNNVEVRCNSERIAIHPPAPAPHQTVTQLEHHHGFPLGSPRSGKTLIHIRQSAPIVEQRPLDAYESVATDAAS